MSNWPFAPLSEVAEPVERCEVPVTGNSYRQVGVKLWGVGAYEREPIDGGGTQYKTLSRVEADDIIVNKIWARNGSVAVVPTNLAGCYVSAEFPTFTPIPDKLEPRWFHWITKTRFFWDQCDVKSRGTSGKNRIRPDRFLEIQIPLPPPPEQRRIVARIEELATKINEARDLRQKAAEETTALLNATRRAVFTSSSLAMVELQDVCSDIIDNLHSNPQYADFGIPCVRSPDVGYGTLNLEGALRTDEDEYGRRTIRGEPRPDDVVLVREGGGTGKCALVLAGQRFSLGQRVMMLRPNKEMVVPKFFLHQLLSPVIQEEQIAPLSKGSASPHLNIAALKRFSFRLPPLPKQQCITAELDAVLAEVDELKKVQSETAVELEALLPSILDKAFKGEL
jgi:type I restriction enzyme S subunit